MDENEPPDQSALDLAARQAGYAGSPHVEGGSLSARRLGELDREEDEERWKGDAVAWSPMLADQQDQEASAGSGPDPFEQFLLELLFRLAPLGLWVAAAALDSYVVVAKWAVGLPWACYYGAKFAVRGHDGLPVVLSRWGRWRVVGCFALLGVLPAAECEEVGYLATGNPGFYLHHALCISDDDKCPLGILWAQAWGREQQSRGRAKLGSSHIAALADRESDRWRGTGARCSRPTVKEIAGAGLDNEAQVLEILHDAGPTRAARLGTAVRV